MSDLNPYPEFEEKVRKAVDMPNANPEFVNKLRNELVRGPVKMKPRMIFRPAWAVAFVLALAVMAVSVPGVAAAIGRLFGYVPEIGLVENSGDLRILDQSYSTTREGVTLTINYVLVDRDHVEVIYDVHGISPENDGWQSGDYGIDPAAFCGGVKADDAYNNEGDPLLRLPDGTVLERGLTGKYLQNTSAMKPVYEAQVPSDVLEMTFVLKCIPMARHGAVPENWEIPFKLKAVPADMVPGNPVIEVAQTEIVPTVESSTASAPTEEPALPAPEVTLTLEKIVPLDSAAIFYFSLNVENRDPSLISIMPVDAYLVDSLGQKIQLIGSFAWQPFEHRVGSLFEYSSQSRPADGPLTLVVENAVAYYAPMYVEPKQASPEEMSFTFDAGANPQPGQTWDLNNEFVIAGYPLKVSSARAVTWSEVQEPSYIDGSQGYEFGYQFTVESDPSIKMSAEMDIMSESPMCWLTVGSPFIPSNSSLQYTQLCRDQYPSELVKVTIRELAVLLEHTWQSTWTP
jgi:hypothetical protein